MGVTVFANWKGNKMYRFVLFLVVCKFAAGSQHVTNDEFEKYKAERPDEFSGKFDGDIVSNNKLRSVGVNSRIWANGIIPYDMSMMVPRTKLKIKEALDDLQKQVGEHCIKFVERTNERDYVRVVSGTGCHSYVGNVGFTEDNNYH